MAHRLFVSCMTFAILLFVVNLRDLTRFRQLERDQLTREPWSTDRNDDVLLAVEGVCHRRSRLRRRHVDGTDFLPRALVVRTKHRTTPPIGKREEASFTGDHERLGDERPDSALPSGPRNRESLQKRMIADVVRRLTVRNLPEQRALLQIDRRDSTVRRLDQRQPLHRRRDVGGLRVGGVLGLAPDECHVRRLLGTLFARHESERRNLGVRED